MALLVIHVMTSEWCHDLSYIQLASQHQCGVATSFICCLGHSSRQLNLHVTTSLATVLYFFPKIDCGDVVT